MENCYLLSLEIVFFAALNLIGAMPLCTESKMSRGTQSLQVFSNDHWPSHLSLADRPIVLALLVVSWHLLASIFVCGVNLVFNFLLNLISLLIKAHIV